MYFSVISEIRDLGSLRLVSNPKNQHRSLKKKKYKLKKTPADLCFILFVGKSIIGVIASQSFVFVSSSSDFCHLSVSPLQWSSFL